MFSRREKKKTCGLRYRDHKKTNIKYIFMRGAWTLFNAGKKKKGKLEKKKKDRAGVRHCQLALYSRRSLMIHYGADVSRVLVLRGI